MKNGGIMCAWPRVMWYSTRKNTADMLPSIFQSFKRQTLQRICAFTPAVAKRFSIFVFNFHQMNSILCIFVCFNNLINSNGQRSIFHASTSIMNWKIVFARFLNKIIKKDNFFFGHYNLNIIESKSKESR